MLEAKRVSSVAVDFIVNGDTDGRLLLRWKEVLRQNVKVRYSSSFSAHYSLLEQVV